MHLATLVTTFALLALPTFATVTFDSRATTAEDERPPTSRELLKLAGNYSRYAEVAQEILDWQETRDLTELEHQEHDSGIDARAASCFPAIGFTPPKGRAPTIPAYKWWCSRQSEYAVRCRVVGIGRPARSTVRADGVISSMHHIVLTITSRSISSWDSPTRA